MSNFGFNVLYFLVLLSFRGMINLHLLIFFQNQRLYPLMLLQFCLHPKERQFFSLKHDTHFLPTMKKLHLVLSVY